MTYRRLQDKYTPDLVTSEMEKRVQVPLPPSPPPIASPLRLQELLMYKPHTGSEQCRLAAEKETLRRRQRQ